MFLETASQLLASSWVVCWMNDRMNEWLEAERSVHGHGMWVGVWNKGDAWSAIKAQVYFYLLQFLWILFNGDDCPCSPAPRGSLGFFFFSTLRYAQHHLHLQIQFCFRNWHYTLNSWNAQLCLALSHLLSTCLCSVVPCACIFILGSLRVLCSALGQLTQSSSCWRLCLFQMASCDRNKITPWQLSFQQGPRLVPCSDKCGEHGVETPAWPTGDILPRENSCAQGKGPWDPKGIIEVSLEVISPLLDFTGQEMKGKWMINPTTGWQ